MDRLAFRSSGERIRRYRHCLALCAVLVLPGCVRNSSSIAYRDVGADDGRSEAPASDSLAQVDAASDAPDGRSDAVVDAVSRCDAGLGAYCGPGGITRCEDNRPTLVEPCPFACGSDPPQCLDFLPSNLDDRVPFDLGEADLTLSGALTGYDCLAYSATGAILCDGRWVRGAGQGVVDGIDFRILTQAEIARPIGVFSLRRLEVDISARLRGVGAPALAIVASDELVINGIIAVASSTNSGAIFTGAGAYDKTERGPGAAPQDGVAGGGASYGTAGGSGGGGEPPGAVYGNPELVPLMGGSWGADSDVGGGGAMQLVARRRIVCGATGQLDAGGGGGVGGGSSGGAILLEAPSVIIAGFVGANGGGGNEVGPSSGAASGTAVSVPALGRLGGATGSDREGVAQSAIAENGYGGGGAGRIRINTRTGSESFTSLGISPRPSTAAFTVGALRTRR